MYLPTRPDLFARPLGNRELRESSSRCGLHAYPDATTKSGARHSTASSGFWRFTPCAATMVFFVSWRTSFRISVWSCSAIFLSASRRSKLKLGDYLAPVGQIAQVLQRMHL